MKENVIILPSFASEYGHGIACNKLSVLLVSVNKD
jgi:hypothetical protein